MAAIPDSTLPGHRILHDRVVMELDRCEESQSLDFKGSAPWADLKYKIARTAMSLANRRDGGLIVIGVAERNKCWVLEGIADADIATYDEDDANDFVNRYASPPIRLRMVRVVHGEYTYLTISVSEFERSPIVCKKAHQEHSLRNGAIYVRPPGKPRTTEVTEASELHDVLGLAAEKRAKEILETARAIGMKPPDRAEDAFNDELGGL